jgi:hypothetical protein
MQPTGPMGWHEPAKLDRTPSTPAQLESHRQAGEQSRAAANEQQRVNLNDPMQVARAAGIPIDAARYLIGRFMELEAQIAELKKQSVPAHMQNVEKRG